MDSVIFSQFPTKYLLFPLVCFSGVCFSYLLSIVRAVVSGSGTYIFSVDSLPKLHPLLMVNHLLSPTNSGLEGTGRQQVRHSGECQPPHQPGAIL